MISSLDRGSKAHKADPPFNNIGTFTTFHLNQQELLQWTWIALKKGTTILESVNRISLLYFDRTPPT